MTDREKYYVYCEMYDKARELERRLERALQNSGHNVYCVFISVGKEEERYYNVDIEYSKGTPDTYHKTRGLVTEEKLIKFVENKEKGVR